MTNCYETCRFAGENFDCDGQCCTNNIEPIQILTDEQIQREKSIHLIILGDEKNGSL